MKPPKRITRPSLERKSPIRAWSTLFGAPPNGATNGTSNGATNGASSGATNGAGPTAPRASGADAVQRGVEFAYRVSEEYLRQGQAMAQALSQPFSGGGQRPGTEGALAQLTERMLRFSTELSSMWMDAARMMPQMNGGGLGGFGERPGARWPAEGPARPPAPAARPSRGVAIQLESKARARATLDVRGPVDRAIVVEPLRLSGGAARISAVDVDADDRDGPIVVTVRVPAKQAAGTYVGGVLDADTRAPLGAVTVRVTR